MLVLSADEVVSLLDLDSLADALQAAMADLSAGRASVPPRVAALVPERDAMLAAMPAYLPGAGALAAKLVSVFPRNQDRPTHHALVCCFDPATGLPVAVIDGTYLTAARTAAGSAVATRLLARPGASRVAVIGTGVQARAHARALARLPGVQAVLIAGRDAAKARALAGELTAAGDPGASRVLGRGRGAVGRRGVRRHPRGVPGAAPRVAAARHPRQFRGLQHQRRR